MSRGRKIAVAVAGVLVVGALVTVNLKYERKKKVTVQTEKIGRRDLTAVVTASGKIKPKRQVNISASSLGRVTRLAVAEGDLVKEGQFLLELDPAPFTAQVAALQASIASARAALTQSRANLEQAKLELRRLTELKKHDLATDQDLDRAKTSVEVERARAESAQKEIDRLDAELENASHQLSLVTFRAPLAGLITALNVEAGENVVTGTMNNPGTVLMTIADLSEIEAEIDVDETDVVNIRPDQVAAVSIDAFPDRKFRGEVVKVGNSAVASTTGVSTTEQTTNFRVTVALREPVPGIKPALSCSAEIITAVRNDALAVPIQALTIRTLPEEKPEPKPNKTKGKDEETGVRAAAHPPDSGEGPKTKKKGDPVAELFESPREKKEREGVFVIRKGMVHFVPVKTGISGERHFEVVEGLQSGDEVVTGTYQAIRDLKDGDPVKIDNTAKKKEARAGGKG